MRGVSHNVRQWVIPAAPYIPLFFRYARVIDYCCADATPYAIAISYAAAVATIAALLAAFDV